MTDARIARLTKRVLFELPTGLYLASNVCSGRHQPVFAAYVAAPAARAEQWAEIKRAHADGRGCHLFSNHTEFKKWLSTPEGKAVVSD